MKPASSEVRGSVWAVPTAVLLSMLCGTLIIPAVRPFFNTFYEGDERLMHAFVSINALGAALGGPLLTWFADKHALRRRTGAVLALVDALCLFACTLHPSPLVLIGLRALGGAASVGALSILMGSAGQSRDGVRARGVGLAGAATIVAIALGPPLGTVFLGAEVRGPFWGGAAGGVIAAVLTWVFVPRFVDESGSAEGKLFDVIQSNPTLKLAALWVGVERFAIGCFVVTFQIYAGGILGLSSREVGMMYTAFLLPFAIATWPTSKLAARLRTPWLLVVGGAVYALSFFLLGRVEPDAVTAVLIVSGTASAAIYAPCLFLASTSTGAAQRSTAMGILNASGTLGMVLGTAIAGIASEVLRDQGFSRVDTCVMIFDIAAGVVLTVVLLSLPARAFLRGLAIDSRA